LGVFGDGSRTERFQALLREDVNELKGYLVRTSNTHDKRGRDGVFKGRKATFNPVTMRYLAHAWGVGRNYPKALLNKQQSAPKPKTISPGSLCVIESLEAAKVRYSAKALFILNRIRERSVQEGIFAYETKVKAGQQHVFREEAKAEWVIAERRQPDVVQYWESKSRSSLSENSCIDRTWRSIRRLSSGLPRQQRWSTRRCNFSQICNRLLSRERLAVGTSGTADAAHEQLGSCRFPRDVEAPQCPFVELLQHDGTTRRDLENSTGSVE
jgi:hypothetical protein